HFQRAILISERLSLRERTLDGLMELVTMGVLVLDPAGRILLANDLARTLLREHAGLRDAKSYFGLADRRLHDRFRASLASMCDSSRGSDPPAPIVLSETESHGPLVVVASPLRPDRTWLGRDLSPGTYGPLALVVLHHPRPDPDLWFDALRTHFGLTRAEAALTESLLSGRSLKEHGDQQQVSLNTVKTHWARVRSKTGCRTQAELVRRLSALLPPVRQPDRR
ncbi:MAG: helix-turn-helix transcriptional regulator, partial [Myxococcota bacterium]